MTWDLARLEERCCADKSEFAGEGTLLRRDSGLLVYRDAGCPVLAVAHLDVHPDVQRDSRFTAEQVDGRLKAVSGWLDDRLGVHVILDVLPKHGVKADVLLTDLEEVGESTAQFFTAPPDRYNWMFSFDRRGCDVVMYSYEDTASCRRLQQFGFTVGDGIASDICRLEALGVKGFNFGVGYRDAHTLRCHAWLDDTRDMVDRFVRFHTQFRLVRMPHPASGPTVE